MKINSALEAKELRDIHTFRNNDPAETITATKPFLKTILFIVSWCANWAYSSFSFVFSREDIELCKKTVNKLIKRGFTVKPNYRDCTCLVSWA